MFEVTLQKLLKDTNILFVVKFGSHLYGTATEASDEDYKGVYLPSYKDVLLNRVSKSLVYDTNRTNEKNSADDVDFEIYSLHYFFELARKGETAAIDMLHANEASIVYETPLWREVCAYRSLFYTRNMKALVGYASKQAAKYGMKGARLEAAKTLREFLEMKRDVHACEKMSEVWDDLPEQDHLQHLDLPHDKGIKTYSFCGKQIQSTVKIEYVLNMVDAFENTYGHRAKKAQADGGTDWKAISHAIRAAMQLREIFETGDLTFPLKEAAFLRDVKEGKVDVENALTVLEAELAAVEKLSGTVDLPENVNNASIDDFLLYLLKEEYKNA